MRTLIIYTHPDTPGHNPEILKAVEKQLKDKAIDFETIDLYKLNYDPILHEDELYTAGNNKITEENKKYQQKIKESDVLIFIYPVWAFSMPAMLNGFMCKVFTPGFAADETSMPPKGLLHQKAIVITTSGAPKFFTRTPRKVIKACLKYCGMKPKIFLIGSCYKVTEKSIAKINKTVKKALNNL